jgi:hypothetical protein
MHNSSELEWVCQNSSSRYISLAVDTLRGRAWPAADNANVLNEGLGFPTRKYKFLIYGEDLQDPHEGCWGCSWQMQSYYALPPAASTTPTHKSHTHQVTKYHPHTVTYTHKAKSLCYVTDKFTYRHSNSSGWGLDASWVIVSWIRKILLLDLNLQEFISSPNHHYVFHQHIAPKEASLTHIASTLAAIFWLIYIASPPRSQGLRGSSFSIFLLKVSSDMGGDQELCTKLQCGTADRADGSAEVASEIVKHLK